MNESNQIDVDHLAIGLTREPMFMGINMRVFFANIVISVLVCIDAHTILGIPLFIILHLFSLKLSIREPNFLYLYTKAFFKTPPILNRKYWGGTNSYEPW